MGRKVTEDEDIEDIEEEEPARKQLGKQYDRLTKCVQEAIKVTVGLGPGLGLGPGFTQ